MQGLEWYDLGNGELIVNVTAGEDTSEVKIRMGCSWTWESTQTRVLPDEGEGATEWLVLIGAKRLLRLRAAEQLVA